jgi:hypothetical protein
MVQIFSGTTKRTTCVVSVLTLYIPEVREAEAQSTAGITRPDSRVSYVSKAMATA